MDPVEISTKDAAVTSQFYGENNDLENQLASLEARASTVIRRIRGGADPNQFSNELWSFVYSLDIRTRAFRKDSSNAFSMALSAFSNSLNSEQATGVLFDQVARQARDRINEIIAKLPDGPKKVEVIRYFHGQDLRAALHQHGLDKIINQAGSELSKLVYTETFERRIADALHGAMSNLLLSGGLPKEMLGLRSKWRLVEVHDTTSLIGDCGAIVVGLDNTRGHFMRFGKDHWKEVYLPISGHAVLVATREENEPSLSLAESNQAFATCSSECFWSSKVSSALLELVGSIGTGVTLASEGDIDAIVDEFWKEFKRQ